MKPGDIILCKHKAKPGKTFEHAAENEISEEIQRLLDGAANRVSSLLELRNHFEPRRHPISSLDDVDVKVKRKIDVLRGRPQRVETRVGITNAVRQLRGKDCALKS